MNTAIVLGAAGRVGDAAARAFIKRGWRVKGAARGAKAATLAPGVEAVQVDAFDRIGLIKACEGADVIVNALNPQYTEWRETVLPMAENVAAAAQATGATHMLPGNVYNFGHAVHPGMKEDAPQVASTEKAEIRIAMENLFAEQAEKAGVQTLILRAGDFYGGTRPQAWLDLVILSKLDKDVLVWPGPMDLPHAFAYLPDLGEAFALLAERRAECADFDSYHFAGHTLTGEEMKRAVEQAVGRPLAKRGVSWPFWRTAGLFVPMMREIAIMSYLWRIGHSLDGTKLANLLGTVPETDPVEALCQAISDLKLDGAYRVAA
ncbi:NmrA family NAD(P)-binding protein [Mesorhizobium xinjiangense]|uniref:NmrA family NAD(P)-binding protein n=1 Tax=Mesorhizobium xinjiangense TaxID=2678685 RepID=UPI0012ED22C7|nr:NmrA family NAD(P)-binding protein [Mesorhizobium xinjiangense]